MYFNYGVSLSSHLNARSLDECFVGWSHRPAQPRFFLLAKLVGRSPLTDMHMESWVIPPHQCVTFAHFRDCYHDAQCIIKRFWYSNGMQL